MRCATVGARPSRTDPMTTAPTSTHPSASHGPSAASARPCLARATSASSPARHLAQHARHHEAVGLDKERLRRAPHAAVASCRRGRRAPASRRPALEEAAHVGHVVVEDHRHHVGGAAASANRHQLRVLVLARDAPRGEEVEDDVLAPERRRGEHRLPSSARPGSGRRRPAEQRAVGQIRAAAGSRVASRPTRSDATTPTRHRRSRGRCGARFTWARSPAPDRLGRRRRSTGSGRRAGAARGTSGRAGCRGP